MKTDDEVVVRPSEGMAVTVGNPNGNPVEPEGPTMADPLERFPSRYREPTECFPWRAGASRAQVPYIQVKTAVGDGPAPASGEAVIVSWQTQRTVEPWQNRQPTLLTAMPRPFRWCRVDRPIVSSENWV
jgi:hypothetical protein